MQKEYIEREVVLALRKVFSDKENGNEHFLNGIETAIEFVQNIPAADVAEVVRCKDCKHWDTGYGFCKIHGLDGYGNSLFGEHGFCSCGERKE